MIRAVFKPTSPVQLYGIFLRDRGVTYNTFLLLDNSVHHGWATRFLMVIPLPRLEPLDPRMIISCTWQDFVILKKRFDSFWETLTTIYYFFNLFLSFKYHTFIKALLSCQKCHLWQWFKKVLLNLNSECMSIFSTRV